MASLRMNKAALGQDGRCFGVASSKPWRRAGPPLIGSEACPRRPPDGPKCPRVRRPKTSAYGQASGSRSGKNVRKLRKGIEKCLRRALRARRAPYVLSESCSTATLLVLGAVEPSLCFAGTAPSAQTSARRTGIDGADPQIVRVRGRPAAPDPPELSALADRHPDQ
jgi:hypothetical protein